MNAPVREGDVLAGKYRVDRVLGVGGMGVVVAATHLQLDQKVALKFMLPEAFANPEALARFQREARAAVRLKSEHVARVSDTGTFENGSPYIVMEFLEGTDLSGVLEREGPLAPSVVAEYIVQACDALAEAHSLGIVHRDLKPANLFLTRRADGSPLVKVLDFGISKANSLTEGGLGMTKTASMMGSPLYMSPEQMKSAKDVDARTDVWSLGIIMYELLGGRVPFNSDTLGGLLAQVMTEAHPPLERAGANIPPELSRLVNYCLEKDVGRRCPNVAELARGLAPFCPPRSQPLVERIATVIGVPKISASAHTVALGPQPSLPAIAQTGGAWGATGERGGSKSNTGLVLGIAAATLVVLSVVGGGAFFALRGRASATADPATTTPTMASAQAATAMPATPATSASPTTTATATPVASASSSASEAATSPSPSHVAGRATTKAKPTAAPAPSVAPAVAATATTTVKKPGLLDTSN